MTGVEMVLGALAGIAGAVAVIVAQGRILGRFAEPGRARTRDGPVLKVPASREVFEAERQRRRRRRWLS